MKAYTQVSDNISFAYPYLDSGSNENLLLGTTLNPTTSPATYQITSIDLTVTNKAMNWGISGTESWVQTWLPANLPILSKINQPKDRSYHILRGISTPYFFIMKLKGGSIHKGPSYIPNFLLTNLDARDLSISDPVKTLFILLYYSSGFVIISYDIAKENFVSAYKGSSHYINVVRSKSGYFYYGGQLISNSYAFITDIIGENNYSQNPSFTVTLFNGTLEKSNLLQFKDNKTDSIIYVNSLSLSDTTSSFSNPGKYTISNINLFSIIENML